MSLSSFNMCMDAMMRKLTEGSAGGVIVGQERYIDLDFADDVALLAHSWFVLMGVILNMEEGKQRFSMSIWAKIVRSCTSAVEKEK